MSSPLDRAEFGVYNEAIEPRGSEANPKNLDIEDLDNTSQSKLTIKAHHVSDRLKSIFQKKENQDARLTSNVRRELKDNAPTLAPPPSKDGEEDRLGEPLPEKKILPPAKEIVKHPLDSAKEVIHSQGGSGLAAKIAKTDVAHGDSVKLVRAAEQADADENDENLRLEISKLKKSRQDSFVRWTLDRHVRQVTKRTVFEPKLRENCADRNEYLQQRLQHHVHQIGGQYIDISSDRPSPSQDAIIASFERVLLMSSPIQNLFMRLGKISHWEDPRTTIACICIYLILWWFNKLMGSLVSHYIYPKLYHVMTLLHSFSSPSSPFSAVATTTPLSPNSKMTSSNPKTQRLPPSTCSSSSNSTAPKASSTPLSRKPGPLSSPSSTISVTSSSAGRTSTSGARRTQPLHCSS